MCVIKARKKVKIQQIQSTNCPNFKGTYIIRVPQKVFKNPENMRSCVHEVDKALSGGGKLYAYIEAFRALFSKKSTGKVMTSENGFLIDAKNKDGMHTFNVISGTDRDVLLKKLSLKNIIKQINIYADAGKKVDSKEIASDILRQAKWEMSQKPTEEIEVKSLAELKEYTGKL